MKPQPPEEAGEIHESFVMSLGQQLAAAVAEQLQEYRERKDYAGLWGSMESYGTWPDYADLLSNKKSVTKASQHVSTRMVPLMMTTPWCSSSPHCISRPRTSPRLSSGTTTMRSTGTVPHSGVFTTPCCTCSFHVNKTTTAILLVTEELIRQWAAQGFLATTNCCKPRAVQAADIRIKGHHANDIYQVSFKHSQSIHCSSYPFLQQVKLARPLRLPHTS